MKITKKLEEKRNELAKDHGSYIARMLYCGDQDPRPMYSRLDFRCGFDSACDLLLPEIEKLEKALFRLTVRLDESASIHDIKPSADIVNEALQSLREFLGEI